MTLSSVKGKLVYQLIIACSAIALLYLYLQHHSTQKEAARLAEEKASIQRETDMLRNLILLDTLLMEDQYNEAHSEIQRLRSSNSDSIFAAWMAIREKVISHLQANWTNEEQRPSLPDISFKPISTRPDELSDSSINVDSLTALQNKLDSMAFALQKAELFADKLQVQVDENTSGNYLSFKSSKGNSVYYVGDVKGGKANGTGVGLLSTGSRYEGQWKNNQKHGKGVFQWQDGALYNGDYKNDLRHGTGTYYWPDGQRFVGKWEKDVRSGQGTFYDADGKMVATGLWRDDELVKRKKEK